jgi:hypothetical protein
MTHYQARHRTETATRKLVLPPAARVAAVGVAAGAMMLPAAIAEADAPANGATIVFVQNGVVTHNLCASSEVFVQASGFAPGRRQVHATIQIVGSGALFDVTIPLSAGSGQFDTGAPGPHFIGMKARLRYQTGSSDNPSNNGSYSASIKDC